VEGKSQEQPTLVVGTNPKIPVHILALHSRLNRRDEFRARPAAEKDAAALAKTV
jgi:hypothetical protein